VVILDTDHLSLLEWTEQAGTARLRQRLDETSEPKATTIINYEEQTRGWLSYLAKDRSMTQQIEAYRRLGRQLKNYCALTVLEFDERAAVEFQRLRQARLRVGTMDLKIAAIVLAHGAILLSRNRTDFGRVLGLRIEDWTV